MKPNRPTWENYEKTIEEAKAANSELAEARKELEELKALNKQMLTEMQVEASQPVVPIHEAKFINGLGKLIIPVEDTLTSHYRLVYDRSNELDFWPEQSPAFDGLVAQTFLAPAFSSPSHPHYFDYEPLRDNVATVRNYVMHAVLNNVDPTNEKELKTASRKLEQMGREIGVALQRDTPLRRPGSDHIDVHRASVPGSGAAEIYALLVKKQEKNKFLHPVKKLFGFDYSDWNLLPVEKSPFSKGHVDNFCLGEFSQPDNPSHMSDVEVLDMTRALRTGRREAEQLLAQQEADMAAEGLSPAPPVEAEATAEPSGLSMAQQISVLGAAIAGSAHSLERVKQLPAPVKQRSVEIARDILDKLRVSLGSTDSQQWMSFSAEEALAQGDAISSVAALYGESYQAALAIDPQLADDPTVQAGNEALGKLAYLMKQHAAEKSIAEGRADDAQMILDGMKHDPEAWKNVEQGQVSQLLDQLQAGLELTHATVEQALLEHAQSQEAQQPPTAPGTPPPVISQQRLQELLKNGGLSQQDIETVRHMQSQAAAMPPEPPKQPVKLAETISRAATMEPTAQQGDYRTSVQGQQRDAEFLKR